VSGNATIIAFLRPLVKPKIKRHYQIHFAWKMEDAITEIRRKKQKKKRLEEKKRKDEKRE